MKEKLEYMHGNPVKRKPVTHPKDWPWSGWSHYAKGEEGMLRIDSIGKRVAVHLRPQTPGKVKNRTLKTEGCGTQSLLTTLRVLHPPAIQRAPGVVDQAVVNGATTGAGVRYEWSMSRW